MFRITLAGLVLLAAISAACAAAYDDYSQGLAAKNRGDTDLALAKFTAAINAGDLNAGLMPAAYINRGALRMSKDSCADAVDDFTAALKLKPGDLHALDGRAEAYTCLLKFDQAIADYNLVMAASPDADMFRHRGEMYWLSGKFDAAAADFQKATELDSKEPYSWLWLEIMRVKAGKADIAQMGSDVRHLSLSEWPLPAFELFEKQLTPDQVMAATAKDGGSETLQGRQCEANFYNAEWWLTQKKPELARPPLQAAVKDCPRTFYERSLAAAELRQLK